MPGQVLCILFFRLYFRQIFLKLYISISKVMSTNQHSIMKFMNQLDPLILEFEYFWKKKDSRMHLKIKLELNKELNQLLKFIAIS